MTVEVDGLPTLSWFPHQGTAHLDGGGALVLRAAPETDWVDDAFGTVSRHDASALGFVAPPRFSLAARVAVAQPRNTFDAGALVLWADEGHWAKLCFECSPAGEAMVVSCVTNGGVTDDCNSTVVTEPFTWLRVLREGPAYAFHSSPDGDAWDFVRQFRLRTDAEVRVGFLAQAPTARTCEARFDRIRLADDIPDDLRDGD